MTPTEMSKRRKLSFATLMLGAALAVAFVLGELLIMAVRPRESMYPRWAFSAEYGTQLYPNTSMVHKRPGQWKFTYTTNAYRYRGEPVPLSNNYLKTNVVVLGDSFSFGQGVDDGEEYPAIMRETLMDAFDVVNLGVGGWGLTQEIRRYYEFGQLYDPPIVILQFAVNDPEDNFNNQVTSIEGDRFTFQSSRNTTNWLKQYLSDSIIQKSQIYNLFRDSAYQFFKRQTVEEATQAWQRSGQREASPAEELHVALLELFASDLSARGVRLIMIAVNDQLNYFPHIKRAVADLDTKGLLRYVEVTDWFKGVTGFESPEGHEWGAKAHQIIGSELAEIVRDEMTPADAVPSSEASQ